MVGQNTANIEIDFRRDWGEILRQKLIEDGYSVPSSLDIDAICLQYFNVLKRRLEPLPRKVLRASQFSSPSAHIEGINMIAQKAKAGESLMPHLNKIHAPKDADSLLNSWGIYHFHLGTSIEKSGYTNRTGALLFARVTDSHFYMLDVLDHKSWYKKSLIEIIHNNWPESIDMYRMPEGYTVPWAASSKEEIRSLRTGNANTILQLSDGTLYMSLGGGQAINGIGTDIRVTCNSYYGTIRNFEKHVLENLEAYRAIAREHNLELPERPCFRLQLIDNVAYALETNAGIAYELRKLPLRILMAI